MARIINFVQRGEFKKTDRFLHRLIGFNYRHKLAYYGEQGVEALKAATPKDSGKTAEGWGYEIAEEDGRLAIYWRNDRVNKGVNIAVILQYGHGTGTGGWVEGVDYINPALAPVFDRISKEAWKELIE